MESNILEFRATVVNNRYNSDEYKIYVANIDEKIYPNIKSNKGEITLVGNIPNLVPNIEYDVRAIPKIDKKYGLNYSVKSIKRDKPTDNNSTRAFLEEVLNSKSQVDILLEVYPNIIDKVIKNDLSDIDLNKLKGIGDFTFDRIKSKIIENFALIDLVDKFGGLIDINMIKKLYDKYTNVKIVEKKLKSEPYKCLCNLSRVGFKTADSILLNIEKLNIKNPDKYNFKFDFELKESIHRMKACLDYILQENENSGNTRMGLKEARENCGKLVPECINLFVPVIKENDETIHVDLKNKIISTKASYEAELKIANFVKEMINGNDNKWGFNTEIYREISGMPMTDEQLETLNMMCNNNIGILTACGGSGKTYSVQGLISMLEDNNKTYRLMTPTGASSKVLSDYVGRDCGTIHRQLAYKPNGEDNPWGFNEENKLTEDIVIIDEFSMVDIFLLGHIIDAMNTNKTKLLLVFDPYQLPSVSCGNIAQDLLSSGIIPTVILTKIFRYAEGGLMQVVTKIRNSEQFLPSTHKGNHIFGTKKDFIYSEVKQELIPKQLLSIYSKLMNDGYGFQDIMVLSCQNKGDYGTKEINKKIQYMVQKDRKNRFVMRGDTKFFKDDKVIQIVNNYKAKTTSGGQTEVFNGNTGIVKLVRFNEIDVEFRDRVVTYTKEELSQLELGYVISTHKCISGDTLIYTNKGIKKLIELDNGANVGEFKDLDNDILVYNGRYMEKPKAFYNDGVSMCNVIKSKRGYSLTATENHRIKVIGNDGRITEKFSKDITTDDYMIINKSNNIYQNITEIPSYLQEEITGHAHMKKYNLPKKIDLDFCKFIGFMIADGTVCSSGIKFGKNQLEVVEEFCVTVKKLFNYDCKIKHIDGKCGGMYLVEVNSTFIRDYCKKIKGIQPHDKFVPDFILQTNKQNQSEFLKALFEDGSVALRNGRFDHVEIVMFEESMINQVRMMLLNMGIVTSFNKYGSKKASRGYSNRISIYGKDAMVYKENIGFFSHNKLERLNLIPKASVQNETIPNLSDIMRNILLNNGAKATTRLVGGNIMDSLNKNRITTNLLEKFIKIVENLGIECEDLEYLKDICYNVFFDKVKSISKKESHTYCLEMPETHEFVQNGIKAMNSQGDSSKQVICIAPKSHTFMLNSNLLYVAGTRAKERVFMIGNIQTINNAIKKKENFNRDTNLKMLLA